MKTWEMIKELTENPEKKFTQAGDDDKWVEFERNRLVWKGRGQKGQPFVVCSSVGYTWEEVKKPVDFMTAFQAFRSDGKDIYCIYNDTRTDYFEDSDKDYCFYEDKIEHGKWYIE